MIHSYHTHTHTLTQLLSSLRVLLTLPPPTPSTPSQDLYKQAANGIAELAQARASLITTPSDWSILFAVIEYIGLGLSPEHSKHLSQVPIETTADSADGGVSHDSDQSSDLPVSEVQNDWVLVTETVAVSTFDLLTDKVLPTHEPQVRSDIVHGGVEACLISLISQL